MTASRIAALLLVAVLAAACRKSSGGLLPEGRYAGSWPDDTAITIEVKPGEVRVNRTKATYIKPDVNSAFQARRLPGRPTFDCALQARGREIRCSVEVNGTTQTIELMRE